MAISLADIKKLRDMTSAGMMDCKKALEEAEGEFKRAVEILREKGKSTLAKRGDNETTQGAVLSRIDGGKAVLVCLGCETDFVAATPDFKALAAQIADKAIAEFILGFGITTQGFLLQFKIRPGLSSSCWSLRGNS